MFINVLFLIVSNLALDPSNENHYHFYMNNSNTDNKPIRSPLAPAQGSPIPARVSSRTLLGGRGELLIEHEGREYRLRLTQNGKLILTA
jgi:hemin uptake protein HemP